MKKALVIILGAIVLSSCDKETNLDYFVKNESSNEISVSGSNIIQSSEIDISIDANENQEVARWSKLGKQNSYFEPTTVFGNDLVIINSEGDSLRKDYKEISNWTSEIKDSRGSANHTYILTVTDSDF